MYSRNIHKDDVRFIIDHGKSIVDYPDDKPYPSKLLLVYVKKRPLHVVVAYNSKESICIIVTVYEPDKKFWYDDFKTKRK